MFNFYNVFQNKFTYERITVPIGIDLEIPRYLNLIHYPTYMWIRGYLCFNKRSNLSHLLSYITPVTQAYSLNYIHFILLSRLSNSDRFIIFNTHLSFLFHDSLNLYSTSVLQKERKWASITGSKPLLISQLSGTIQYGY